MIAIIDYKLGNLTSVANALENLSIPFQITADKKVIEKSKGIILPGVGAAGQGMKNLKERNLDSMLINAARNRKSILGICLGMQLLFSASEEGDVPCLDIVKGKVKKFSSIMKVPQIGWNQVSAKKDSMLLKGIVNKSYFYFVNSYYCDPTDKDTVSGITNYDKNFCSVLENTKVFGTQFHPEKSSENGLQLLQNFWEAVC